MEENPQAPKEQEVCEDPQEKASDARKEAFIEEFIRAHEELLLAENSFFKRLAPAGFLLDAVLFSTQRSSFLTQSIHWPPGRRFL